MLKYTYQFGKVSAWRNYINPLRRVSCNFDGIENQSLKALVVIAKKGDKVYLQLVQYARHTWFEQPIARMLLKNAFKMVETCLSIPLFLLTRKISSSFAKESSKLPLISATCFKQEKECSDKSNCFIEKSLNLFQEVDGEIAG